MQIANNNCVEDYRASCKTVIPDFTGKPLELKYNARTKAELDNLLARKNVADEVSQYKADMKFSRISARLFHRNFKPSLSDQFGIVDWQAPAFDEITVQFLGNSANLEQVYDYVAKTYKKPIVILCPVSLPEITLAEVLQIIKEKKPFSTKWKFGKIQTFLSNYRAIAHTMKAISIPCFLTGARLRYGEKTDAKNCDVSLLVQAAFGFEGSCLDYLPASERKKAKDKRVFVTGMDSINVRFYEWETIPPNKDYKTNRLRNYKKLDEAKLTPIQIATRMRFAQLVATLTGTAI